ncbi:MAG: DUF1838 domain-containing protein [Gammaproteobacteria bacterium]|nr:MAG: DUF1838 domain-containing protein [Gammaproteobacteria bacterium]
MIDRRGALRALSIPALGAFAPVLFAAERSVEPAPAVPDRSVPDLSDPAVLLEAYMRLSGALDDRLIIWWMDGVRYGVVDARAQALFGMKIGLFHRFYRQADGSFKLAMFELTYYTDLASGEMLETFDNPYTGQTDRVSHVRLGPEVRIQTRAGIARPDNPLVKDYTSSLGPALIRGDDVWIPTSVEARIKFPKPTAPEILLSLYTTVHGTLRDALNPALISAPCSLAFQNVLKWEPFMRMGDRPGHMMSQAAGKKLESVDALPADYLRIAERMHGKYIRDPIGALERLTDQLRKPVAID